ncbi:MAG: MBOAT family protein [Lachnospiraceae bacterium]|nr:MBOAT family protein [Lachnospiraceae bacterium]
MVFSSIVFLFRFLPIFMICYFLAPGRMKNFILLLGSLFFYAWGEPVYVLLMLFSTVSDYMHGLLIGHYHGRWQAKIFLISSIVVNLGVLGFFKYADFLIGLLNGIPGVEISLLQLPLPIGISFYTFQTMSYSIDVYRGEVKAQKNLLDFAVFVTMFPQLIAGPIVKYHQIDAQLHTRKADVQQVYQGVVRFVIGLGKKVLLANNLGLVWSQISGGVVGELTVLTSWLGIICYAFQIYFDFSGYSDMAIGLGKVLGFHFPENFNYPYISASVTEFWRRWHISLSTWFREYVYITLGGNRKGLSRQLVNILIVWMLTGIWHGAGVNFLLWGLWYALFLILEKLFLGSLLKVLPKTVGRIYTWFVVLVGWVFFELQSAESIGTYLAGMFGVNGLGWADRQGVYVLLQQAVVLIIGAIGATPLIKNSVKSLGKVESGGPMLVFRLGAAVSIPLLLLLCIAYIVDASYNPFLYFRF